MESTLCKQRETEGQRELRYPMTHPPTLTQNCQDYVWYPFSFRVNAEPQIKGTLSKEIEIGCWVCVLGAGGVAIVIYMRKHSLLFSSILF